MSITIAVAALGHSLFMFNTNYCVPTWCTFISLHPDSHILGVAEVPVDDNAYFQGRGKEWVRMLRLPCSRIDGPAQGAHDSPDGFIPPNRLRDIMEDCFLWNSF